MNRPDLKKRCETCCGTGEHMTDAGHFPCRVCHGEKEVYNYLTPEQWPYEMLDSDQIWIGFGEVGNYTWRAFPYDTARHLKESNPLIIARAGQPKPPEEWRPE